MFMSIWKADRAMAEGKRMEVAGRWKTEGRQTLYNVCGLCSARVSEELLTMMTRIAFARKNAYLHKIS
jgi:hypothetical protein